MTLAIDVVIPTYNRPELLEKAVRSLLAARVPPGLTRRILVVDNNSTDQTDALIARLAGASPGIVIGHRATMQGRSAALNAGIEASSAPLVGIIDDDEQVSPGWFEAAAEWMSRQEVGFIGGPIRGDWEGARPAWIPEDRPAVIGEIDPGPDPLKFGSGYQGILMGGNCVIRREVFERVGMYSTGLGRTARGLLSGEDQDFYVRLMEAGVEGWYVPELAISHFIPRTRTTRRYFRSWCYWHGVSLGRRARSHREPAAYLAGIPRYHFGRALAGLRAMVSGSAARRFGGELEWWSLAGMLVGRHRRAPD